MLEKNKVYQGDCFEVMKNIDDKSIDMVLTDPPYNISKDNNFKTMGRAGIDFGEWDKEADIYSYINEVYRVLNKNGSFVVFTDWKKVSHVVEYAEKVGFITKDLIRLEKTNPMPRNRDRRYITDFELAIWFVMPKAKWVFNRQSKAYERPKFVGNIEKGLHTTQKNKLLMKWLINIHTNARMTILDPFCGSGTTGVACIETDRNFILIEKEKKYVDVSNKRIKEALNVRKK